MRSTENRACLLALSKIHNITMYHYKHVKDKRWDDYEALFREQSKAKPKLISFNACHLSNGRWCWETTLYDEDGNATPTYYMHPLTLEYGHEEMFYKDLPKEETFKTDVEKSFQLLNKTKQVEHLLNQAPM